MRATPSPTAPRRRVSIRTQLILGFGLILVLNLISAVIGYLSLTNLQASFQSTFEDAGQIRELSLEAQTEFLLARQSEANFLARWRTLGYDAAAAENVLANHDHLTLAQSKLDDLDKLVQATDDAGLRQLTDETARLRPLLNEYQNAFSTTVFNVQERSGSDGLENALQVGLDELEAAISPLANPEFLELILHIRASEQGYFNTSRQQHIDDVRLLVNRFVALMDASSPADLTAGTTTLSAGDLAERARTYYSTFATLVRLDQAVATNTTVFQDVTTDINQITARIGVESAGGVSRARTRLEAASRQSAAALIGTAILSLGLAILAAFLVARRILLPLNQFGQAARQIGQGNLEQSLTLTDYASHEFVVLAQAFNAMTARLRDLIGSLEQRVTERTETLRRQNEYLAALHDTTLGLMNRLDLKELLETLVTRAGQLLSVRNGFIYLVLPGEAEMERQIGVGIFNVNRAPRLKPGEGLSGRVWQTGQPLVVNDYDNWPGRSPVGVNLVHAMVGVPLYSGSGVAGVLALASDRDTARTFGDDEVELLSRFARLASVALDNARLFAETQQRLRELESINSISQALVSQLDLNAVIELVGERLRQTFNAQSVYVALYNQQTKQIHFLYDFDGGQRVESRSLPLGEGLSSKIIQSHQPLLINQDFERHAGEIGVRLTGTLPRSYLGVPILVGEEVIGVISVQDTEQENRFGESDVHLLTTVAANVGVAIENARLFAETNQRLRELATINNISQALVSQLELSAVIDLVGERLRELFGAQYIYIALHDERTHLISFPYFWDIDHRVVSEEPLPYGEGLTSRVLEAHQPQLINSDWARRAAELGAVAMTEPLPKSSLGVPILVGEHVIGVIMLQSTERENLFTDSDVRLLTTIAAAVGVAIENARLFETERTARQQAETLRAATQALSTTLELQQVFEVILSELQKVVPYDSASVQQLKGQRLEIIGGVGFSNLESVIGVSFDLTSSDNPNRKVMETRRALILDEASTDYAEFRRGVHAPAQISSWMGVPLLFGDRLIGMITLDKREPRFYSEAHARLAMAFAAQAAIAIENARLFAEAQKAKEEADAANQAKSTFLSSVSHELRTPLTSVLGFTKIIQKRLEDTILANVQADDRKIQRAIGQVRENLGIILAEGDRLTAMINDVLDLAKIEAGKVDWKSEPVAVAEVIERATAATTSLFTMKGLALVKDVPAGLPETTGDRDRLIQVVINLISNAVKFTEKGSVTCRARQVASRGEIVVSVADTGLGIALEDQRKVFERFVQVGDTLTDKPHGTGLGLPICKEIVEYHGGRIWLESALGQGSTFSFALPIN